MAEETKNTKPADEEIEKTAEPTAGEEKQPEKAESDTAAAKEEQPEKKDAAQAPAACPDALGCRSPPS